MSYLKIATGVVIGAIILWAEYRYDQTSHSPLLPLERIDVIRENWPEVYSTLQSIRFDKDKYFVWPAKIAELDQIKQQWGSQPMPPFAFGVQNHLQNAMMNYLSKRTLDSLEYFKSVFTLYTDFPYPETLAMALYGWRDTMELKTEFDRQMNCFFGMYLTVIDVQFADRVRKVAGHLKDPFLKSYFLALAQLVSGDSRMASRIMKSNPPDATSDVKALLLSELAYGVSDLVAQVSYLEKSVSNPIHRSNPVVAYRGYHVLANKMENYAESIRWLKPFTIVGAARDWHSYWLGLSYHTLGQFPEADETYKRITPKFVHQSSVMHSHATVLNSLKKYQEAILLLSELNKRAPSSIVQMELANSLSQVGQPEESERLLKAVVTAEPNNFSALYSLGQVQFYHLSKFDEATASFKRASVLSPNDAQLQKTLADIAIAKSRIHK